MLIREEMIKFPEEELRLVASEEDELKKPFELTGAEELELDDFEAELLLLLTKDKFDENDLELNILEEALEEDLLELVFTMDELELFCE